MTRKQFLSFAFHLAKAIEAIAREGATSLVKSGVASSHLDKVYILQKGAVSREMLVAIEQDEKERARALEGTDDIINQIMKANGIV